MKKRPSHKILTYSKFAKMVSHSRKSVRSCKFHSSRRKQTSSCDNLSTKGEIQVDFVFSDPKPGDYHGVKTLFLTYLSNTQWDLSGFVDLLLGQINVGTVVKIENSEDDGVYAFVSALNLGRFKECECIVQLKKFLSKVCHDKRLFLDDNVAILVSQRVVNLPYQLIPPLYDALFDEVSWATEDEPTEELQNSFRFKSYIIISKIYKHNKVLNGCHPTDSEEAAFVYIKIEDEIFLKLSSWHRFFPLNSSQETACELKNYRPMGIVMAIEADRITEFRKELHSIVG